MRSGSMLPVILLSLLLLSALGSMYQIGDSVPLARMEQFHGQRTSWLHQLGQHSPHFGVDTEVVMPIPKPSGFSDDDAYKIYNYEDVPNSWIHEGSDAASAPCCPASTSEFNEMILNTPPLSTKNFTTFANSSITFCVQRPLEKQLHREEVLVIRSLKFEKSLGPTLNAFLYFPTANPTTPITCIEYFARTGGFGIVFSFDLPDSKMEWQLALGYKLQSLGMDQFSHVVVTLVQQGLPQIIQLKNAEIVYFDD